VNAVQAGIATREVSGQAQGTMLQRIEAGIKKIKEQ